MMRCRIQIKGHLTRQWNDWFGGLAIDNRPDGQALLSGELQDTAALYGLLRQMSDLGIELTALHCWQANSGEALTRERLAGDSKGEWVRK